MTIGIEIRGESEATFQRINSLNSKVNLLLSNFASIQMCLLTCLSGSCLNTHNHLAVINIHLLIVRGSYSRSTESKHNYGHTQIVLIRLNEIGTCFGR